MGLKTVSVAFKRKRGPGRLRWIDCSAETSKEAYRKIRESEAARRMTSEGFREYGIIGL